MDASENDTTTYQEFKNKKWYKIRLKVAEDKIEAWIDGKQIVEQELKGKKIGIRYEVDLSKPFGFACWQTTAALKNIRIRSLADAPKQEKPRRRKRLESGEPESGERRAESQKDFPAASSPICGI